jgi:hypothetical protein
LVLVVIKRGKIPAAGTGGIARSSLAAEQSLPGQAVKSFRAGGTDHPSQYKSYWARQRSKPDPKLVVSLGATQTHPFSQPLLAI